MKIIQRISETQKTSLLKIIYIEGIIYVELLTLWGRDTIELIDHSLFLLDKNRCRLHKLEDMLANTDSCLEALNKRVFSPYVDTLTAQWRKYCGLKWTLLVQKNQKYRTLWWLGLRIFEASEFENVHCCQSWPQMESISCKCSFFLL